MLIFASFQKVKDMKHLTKAQRYTISMMYGNGFPIIHIANTIGVHKSTISRELRRNKDESCGIYDGEKAQSKRESRQRSRPRFRSLTEKMRETIVTKLSLDWSPEQIKGYCTMNSIDCVSHEAIYQMIWRDKKCGGKMYTHLRRKGRHKAKRGSKNQYRGIIPNRVDIDARPSIVEEKKRFGDLEGDTVIGKSHKGAIVTINDRMTGISWSEQLDDKGAGGVADAIIRMLLPF